MTEGTDVTCTHCDYEWTYTGSMAMATCPSCTGKTLAESESVDEPEESEVSA